jgi:hypothetical protein
MRHYRSKVLFGCNNYNNQTARYETLAEPLDRLLLKLETRRPFSNISPTIDPRDLLLRRVEIAEHTAWDQLVRWAERRYPLKETAWLSSYETFHGRPPCLKTRTIWLNQFIVFLAKTLKQQRITQLHEPARQLILHTFREIV